MSPGENLIRHRHTVIRIAARDVVASNGQQQLAFLDRVAEPRVNGRHAAGGERDDRDVAGNVGGDRARDHQLGGGGMLGCRSQRKLLGMVYREEVDVRARRDFGGRRILRGLVAASAVTGGQRQS